MHLVLQFRGRQAVRTTVKLENHYTLKKKSINKSDKKLHGNSPVEWSKEWTGTGEMDQHIQALAVLPENQGSTPHMAAYHLL